MAEKLVQFRPHVHHSLWTLFRDDHIRDFVTIRLPVWFCYCERAFETWSAKRNRNSEVEIRAEYELWHAHLRLHLERLKDEDRFPHVTIRIFNDFVCCFLRYLGYTSTGSDVIQHRSHLMPTIFTSYSSISDKMRMER